MKFIIVKDPKYIDYILNKLYDLNYRWSGDPVPKGWLPARGIQAIFFVVKKGEILYAHSAIETQAYNEVSLADFVCNNIEKYEGIPKQFRNNCD